MNLRHPLCPLPAALPPPPSLHQHRGHRVPGSYRVLSYTDGQDTDTDACRKADKWTRHLGTGGRAQRLFGAGQGGGPGLGDTLGKPRAHVGGLGRSWLPGGQGR